MLAADTVDYNLYLEQLTLNNSIVNGLNNLAAIYYISDVLFNQINQHKLYSDVTNLIESWFKDLNSINFINLDPSTELKIRMLLNSFGFLNLPYVKPIVVILEFKN